MADSSDDRSAMAQGIAWSFQITSIALQMVLPGLLGYWIDQKLGTRMLFLVVGLALGMTLALVHLIRLPTKGPRSSSAARRQKNDGV